MNKLEDTLAKRLAWARAQKGLSQEQLAKSAGVSQGTIGNLEAGIRNTARKITAIAAALGVAPGWLADGTGCPVPETGHAAPVASTIQTPSNDLEDAARLLTLFAQSTPDGRLFILQMAADAEKIVARHDDLVARDKS